MHTRVESGSDDPDNLGHLGHLIDGSSGCHPQTKLSGCDPDFLMDYVSGKILIPVQIFNSYTNVQTLM